MAGATVGLAAAPHIAVARPVLRHWPPHGPCDSPLLQLYNLSPSNRLVPPARGCIPRIHSSGHRCYSDPCSCNNEGPVHAKRCLRLLQDTEPALQKHHFTVIHYNLAVTGCWQRQHATPAQSRRQLHAWHWAQAKAQGLLQGRSAAAQTCFCLPALAAAQLP